MQEIFTSFCKGFAALKAARTLDIKPTLGYVTLEVELGTRTVEYCVAPAIAAVLMAFEEHPTWALGELSAHLKARSGG